MGLCVGAVAEASDKFYCLFFRLGRDSGETSERLKGNFVCVHDLVPATWSSIIRELLSRHCVQIFLRRFVDVVYRGGKTRS